MNDTGETRTWSDLKPIVDQMRANIEATPLAAEYRLVC